MNTYRHKKSVNILLPFTLQGLRIATDNKQQPKSTPKYITLPFSYRICTQIATLCAILNSKRSSTYTTHRHSLLHCFAICYDSKVAKFWNAKQASINALSICLEPTLTLHKHKRTTLILRITPSKAAHSLFIAFGGLHKMTSQNIKIILSGAKLLHFYNLCKYFWIFLQIILFCKSSRQHKLL